MQTAHPVIQPFLAYLKFEKRFSPHTLQAYETDLIHFFDYLAVQYGGIELKQITHLYVRSWLAQLKEEGLTGKSINRKISTLRSFFKFCLKQSAIEQSPMTKITAPKSEKRLPQFVAERDMATLINHVEFTDDWKGKTERLLLLLFYNTGMRLSELIQLEEGSFNFFGNTVKVLGKGGKERLIPVQPALLQVVKEYGEMKKLLPVPQVAKNLLVTERGKALSPRSVYTSVKRCLSLVTTIEKRSPHILRHTFATHLTNNGADINAVKELLGHSSLAATQVYTHNTIDRLKNIYKNAHPKA
jgi:integrase/recombinase XerC